MRLQAATVISVLVLSAAAAAVVNRIPTKTTLYSATAHIRSIALSIKGHEASPSILARKASR